MGKPGLPIPESSSTPAGGTNPEASMATATGETTGGGGAGALLDSMGWHGSRGGTATGTPQDPLPGRVVSEYDRLRSPRTDPGRGEAAGAGGTSAGGRLGSIGRSAGRSARESGWAEAGVLAGAGEDRVHHVRGDAAGEGVLLAGVVAAEQQDGASAGCGRGQLGFGTVAERGAAAGQGEAGGPQHGPRRLPGEAAEADDDPGRRGDPAELLVQPGGAGVALGGTRFVGGRGAADRGHHAGVE